MDDTAKDILGHNDEKLFVTMGQLCDFLSKAEKKLKVKKKGELRTKKTHAGKRKLPLEETPERSITVEDEEGWQHEEARATKRANRGDSDYSSSHAWTTGLTRRRSARLGDTLQSSS